MDLDWVPNETAFNELQTSGIPVEFIAQSLHEFRAYWLSRGEKKPDWNPEFIRQTRHQFAYQQQQEQRRHDRSEARSRVSGLPQNQSGRQRRETVTERNERYERFAAGLDTGNDAEFAPKTRLQPTSPGTEGLMPARAIAALWARFSHLYGNRWVSVYGEALSADGILQPVAATWAKALANLTADDLARGLHACLDRAA
ncbi:MAG: hypothetical protein HC889_15360, partial [Synechococcaceae cyanobacterium SM1_2_3]|nr:hypothetical protein [Synechococcaceae cyanobacterium SM1_2_3]